ncbi:MAG: hypothetical protein LQ351_004305 [Letrouitia transgressa]|nr:MAG: hypothetical protein LQ351_004305 [Letrouitia transgressa]
MPRTRKVPSTNDATSTATTTTTEKRFGVQLTKNGILYGRVKTKKPKDINTVKEYLENDRQSISPDEEAYNRYVEQVEWGDNELSMQSNTWPLLAKQPGCTDDAGYTANYNFQWTEVATPLTYGLSDAKPDISESYRWDQYPIEACEALGGSLIPTQYGGAMPTLCVEWKGPDGTMLSAEKQCAYNGALMVEAAGHIHEYMMKDLADFLHKTQALTLALNGEDVHLYSNHVIVKGSSFEYHQYPLHIYKPRNSLNDFKETYRSIRNAQDWARHRATRTKDDLHAFIYSKVAASTMSNQQADETAATGTAEFRNTEHDRHHRVHPNGCNQLFTLKPCISPAVTQPTENFSVADTKGGILQVKPKRKRKGRCKSPLAE